MFELVQKCTKIFTKDDMIAMEEWILTLFTFDMSFVEITYSIIFHTLGEEYRERMVDAEKLLALAVTESVIMKDG
jgi:hypothetical protein